MTTLTLLEPVVGSESHEISSDALFEVIDGRVVEIEGMGAYGNIIASNLFLALAPFIRQASLGRLVFEALFRISPGNNRRPDLAFVSYSRWAKKAPAPIRMPGK